MALAYEMRATIPHDAFTTSQHYHRKATVSVTVMKGHNADCELWHDVELCASYRTRHSDQPFAFDAGRQLTKTLMHVLLACLYHRA